jgi:hypothetical protein
MAPQLTGTSRRVTLVNLKRGTSRRSHLKLNISRNIRLGQPSGERSIFSDLIHLHFPTRLDISRCPSQGSILHPAGVLLVFSHLQLVHPRCRVYPHFRNLKTYPDQPVLPALPALQTQTQRHKVIQRLQGVRSKIHHPCLRMLLSTLDHPRPQDMA